MNRDDGLRRRQRGQHVVRRVKQVEPLAPDGERNRDLLRDRVMPGAIRDGAKVFAERRRDARRPAACVNSTYSVCRSMFGELAQQIPDVGADAEIVQLSGVDANAHGVILVDSR